MRKKVTNEQADMTEYAKQGLLVEAEKAPKMYLLQLNPELTTHYELCMLMNAFGYQIHEGIYNVLPDKLKANFIER